MNRHRALRTSAGFAAILLVGLFATGCAKYASEEDLQALDTQKQAALAAEQKVQQLEATNADLVNQLADRQAEYQEVLAERMAIRKRLTEQGVKLPPMEEMPAPAVTVPVKTPAKVEQPATEEAAPEKIKEPEKVEEAKPEMEKPAEAQPETPAATEPVPEQTPSEETPELENQGLDELQDEMPEEQEEESDTLEDLFSMSAPVQGVAR